MMKLSMSAAILAILVTTACRAKPTKVVVVDSPNKPQTVVVQQDHNHAASCGHYLHNGVWYSDPEHVHVVPGN